MTQAETIRVIFEKAAINRAKGCEEAAQQQEALARHLWLQLQGKA